MISAPFPWFGGKGRAAEMLWCAFNPSIPNYVEPFAGSLATLLARPGGAGKIETVNDLDCYVSNFWRATQHDPEAVADFADYPVNEADLHARHAWLVDQVAFRERMMTDPDYYDVKIAGWWLWGVCIWIGSGWCRPRENGVWRQRPNLQGTSRGLHRKRPRVDAWGGRGLIRQMPSVGGHGGRGIHNPTRRRPMEKDRGIHTKTNALEWMQALRDRLRHVRVCCGDWTRILGPSVIGTTRLRNSGMTPCAILLDPPYDFAVRDADLYAVDDPHLSARVREWALLHGDDPDLRIALCGYEGEHEMPPTWTKVAWKAHGGYATPDNPNAHRERIWLSPHCQTASRQGELFQ